MVATIRTWFINGVELSGSGVRQEIGYSSVDDMRDELKRRWSKCYVVTDIPGGVEINPKPTHNCGHGKQTVVMEC